MPFLDTRVKHGMTKRGYRFDKEGIIMRLDYHCFEMV